jgi:predicted DNA-binding transcriptional regulator YafY
MNANTRQHSILQIIRCNRTTGDELAHRFGVRARTIYRDVEQLRSNGFRISGLRGPGGGFFVEAGSKGLPVTLTADAVREVALVINRVARDNQLPQSATASSSTKATELLHPLLTSLPAAEELGIRTLCASVSPPSREPAGGRSQPRAPAPRSLLRQVQTALVERRRVWMNVQTHWNDRQFVALDFVELEATPTGWHLRGLEPNSGTLQSHLLSTIQTFQVTHKRNHRRIHR